MLRRILAGAALGALLTTPVMAQSPQAPTAGTVAFVTKAVSGGQFEVEASKRARKKAKNAAVKQFAERMVADHAKANKDLAALAKKNGLRVAKKLDTASATKLKTLRAAPSTAFDRTYVEQQTEAHRDAVALFRDYAAKGDNADLKSFASQMLPTLETHAQQIQELDRTLKTSPAAGKK